MSGVRTHADDAGRTEADARARTDTAADTLDSDLDPSLTNMAPNKTTPARPPRLVHGFGSEFHEAHNETYSHGWSLVSPSGTLKESKLRVARGIRWHDQHLPN